MRSSKWDIISHQAIEFKSAWQLSGFFCARMKNEYLSSVEEKITELLTADDLAAACITSTKHNMVSHHSMDAKSARQLSGSFCGGVKNEHLSSVGETSHRIAYNWRPGCSLYDLIQMRHDQSSVNNIQKCLTAVRVFFVEGWKMNTSHPSRVKSPNWLQLMTWLQPVWDIQIRYHQSSLIKFESAWQLSGFFVEGWRTNTSHLSSKKSPNCLQLKTWL